MFNKILLACCSKASFGECIARVKIVLTNLGSGAVGGHRDISGSLQVIEGSLDVKAIYDVGSENTFALFPLELLGQSVTLVNETTGVSKSLFYATDNLDGYGWFQFVPSIFGGITLGQECVIAIYTKA